MFFFHMKNNLKIDCIAKTNTPLTDDLEFKFLSLVPSS